jgi:hypothetical protein
VDAAPAPSPPFDRAAGAVCDHAVHGEPVVDEVVKRVLDTFADGSPRRELYRGALVIRVTDTATGTSYDADVSGTALVDHRPDGSMTWRVIGPVLLGMPGTQATVRCASPES